LALEVERLEGSLSERSRELVILQEEFRQFKTLYTQTIGGRLAELHEVELAIKEAESRLLGIVAEEETVAAEEGDDDTVAARGPQSNSPVPQSLRKLFLAVAKMFHPDMATDEGEARRRHTVMAEASRAYREGDVESLHTLLGDEELQFFCTGAQAQDDPHDLASRLVALKEELRTVEFGIKRIRTDGLYQLKLRIDEEALRGRDALGEQAESLNRQIAKARRRLAHLS
jgi:hypothetical protein